MQNQGPTWLLHVGPGKVGLGFFIRSPGIAWFIVVFFFPGVWGGAWEVLILLDIIEFGPTPT